MTRKFILIFYLFLLVILLFIIIKRNIDGKKEDSYVENWVNKIFKDTSEKKKISFLAGYSFWSKNEHNINGAIDKIRPTENNENIIFIFDGEPCDLTRLLLRDDDIIITTKKELLPKKGKIIYFPQYASDLFVNGIDSKKYRQNDRKPKTKFCYFAYSNCDNKCEGVKRRENFYKKLQKYSGGRVDNLGKCLNNSGKVYKGNNMELFQYKFVIAFENNFSKGYITEKIINPRFAGSIPIYMGAPDVYRYFNPGSFINVRDFGSDEECINFILKVDSNPDLYKNILSKPFFRDGENYDKYISRPGKYLIENLSDTRVAGLLKYKGEVDRFDHPMNIPIQRENLLLLADFLDRHGVNYMLDCGTLLGAIRQNDLIPGDTDVDIQADRRYEDLIKNNLPELNSLGFHEWRSNGEYEIIMMSLTRKNNYIDVYKNINISKLNMKKYMFLGRYFNIPARPEKYLEELYGPGWRTPGGNIEEGEKKWHGGVKNYMERYN